MKSMLFAFLLCALTAGFSAAGAETGWRDLPYALHIEGGVSEGICRVPAKTPGQLQELRAQGRVGGREDAIRLFSILGDPVPQPQEFHIPQEKNYTYLDGEGDIAKDRCVSFSTARFSYNLHDERMDRYFDSAPSWASLYDQSHYTDVAVNLADGVDWRSNPHIRGTGFEERIGEVYTALDDLGVEAYAPYEVIYWDVETLQRNLEDIEEQFGGGWSGFVWGEEDALVKIEIALGLDGVRLKPVGMPTPESTANIGATATAYMTENEVLYLYVEEGMYEKTESASALQQILAPEEVIPLYETYLSQMLLVSEGMETIRAIALEYNVRYKYQAGNFSPLREITPVWSVYTDYQDIMPTVMFSALDGKELPW